MKTVPVLLVVVLAATVGLFVGGAVAAGDLPKQDAAGYFVKDSSGKVRAYLGLSGEGNPVLLFTDSDGTQRAEFGVTQNQPVLRLFDEKSQPRIEAHITPKEGPEFIFYDETGAIRLLVQTDDKVKPAGGYCIKTLLPDKSHTTQYKWPK